MNVMDILKQYADRPTDTETDFDEVARQVSPDVLGNGIAQAFRSDKTPAFGDMIGSLLGSSNPQQRTGLLNQLIQSVGPAVLSGVAGGALGRLLQGLQAKGGAMQPTLTPTETEQLTPQQMKEIAIAAEKTDPTVLDKVGGFYAQHPELVKMLGGAALAIALGQMATRMKR
ncbi:MAG TPA: hypothetical protein VNA44_07910 [Burkholderiaceae bacterium]|nr:hypothetical protein [Burkholderiaceae bacterium]